MRLHISIFVDQIDFPILYGPLAAHLLNTERSIYFIGKILWFERTVRVGQYWNVTAMRMKQKSHFAKPHHNIRTRQTTSILIRNQLVCSMPCSIWKFKKFYKTRSIWRVSNASTLLTSTCLVLVIMHSSNPTNKCIHTTYLYISTLYRYAIIDFAGTKKCNLKRKKKIAHALHERSE